MQDITGKYGTITVPCCTIWREDNNYFRIVNGTPGALVVANPLTIDFSDLQGNLLESVTLSGVSSEVGDITFRLRPYLLAYTPCIIDYHITAEFYDANGNLKGTQKADGTIYCFYGKTFQERQHGSARVITIPPDFLSYHKSLDVFIPPCYSGVVQWGSNNPMQTSACQAVAEIGAPKPPARPDQPIHFSSSKTPVMAGEFWDEREELSWDVDVKIVCPKRNPVTIHYYDTDGCLRFAVGEVLEKKMAVKRDEYHRGGAVYNTVPRSVFSDYDGTFDVGFADVDPLQFLEDILISHRCWIHGRRQNCICDIENVEYEVIPLTLQLVRDGKTKDMVMTFKIDN